MKNTKTLFRTSVIVLVVFCVVLCSFTTGLVRQEALGTPFSTLPPVNATLATPIGASTPVPTPLPTLGPGQYFQDGDDNLPELITRNGDDEFGYGEIKGASDLYLVWVTDENGTYYLVVDKEDEYFSSETKPDDFLDLMSERESILKEMRDIEIKITEQQGSRKGSDQGAIIIVVIGGVFCNIITVGGCFLPFATGGFALVGKAISHNVAAHDLEDLLIPIEEDLGRAEQNILGRFETMKQ